MEASFKLQSTNVNTTPNFSPVNFAKFSRTAEFPDFFTERLLETVSVTYLQVRTPLNEAVSQSFSQVVYFL